MILYRMTRRVHGTTWVWASAPMNQGMMQAIARDAYYSTLYAPSTWRVVGAPSVVGLEQLLRFTSNGIPSCSCSLADFIAGLFDEAEVMRRYKEVCGYTQGFTTSNPFRVEEATEGIEELMARAIQTSMERSFGPVRAVPTQNAPTPTNEEKKVTWVWAGKTLRRLEFMRFLKDRGAFKEDDLVGV